MQLKNLIISVKEKNLSKDQLEEYRDNLSTLFAEMQIELAEIEKEGALFIERMKYDVKGMERTNISIKSMWKASEKGLREITLKRYCLATKELLNSLKSRLYSIY